MDVWTSTPEDEMGSLGVYIVKDTPSPAICEDRASKSLPGNLYLAPSRAVFDASVLGVFSNDIIPKGTKFGPMIADIYSASDPLPDDRKYFWRVYDKNSGSIMFYLDGKNTDRSNWMRHVSPAYDSNAQNLIAYQEGTRIFFLTIKHIHPHEELTVWYCREFAERMGYPATGEAMARELSSLKMKEDELEAQKLAAIEKVKELLNRQKQLEQMKTDLLQQGIARKVSLKNEPTDESFESEHMTPVQQRRDVAFLPTSPRYEQEGSPISDSGYTSSPHSSGSPHRYGNPSSRTGSTSPALRMDDNRVLDLTSVNRRRPSSDLGSNEDDSGPNSYRRHKMKMYKSCGSMSSGNSSPGHRFTPTPPDQHPPMSNHCLPPVITMAPGSNPTQPLPRLPPYFDQHVLISRIPQTTSLAPVPQPVTLKQLKPEPLAQQLMVAAPPESVMQLVRNPPLHHIHQHQQQPPPQQLQQHQHQLHQQQQHQQQKQQQQQPSVSVSPPTTTPASKSSPLSKVARVQQPKVSPAAAPAPKKQRSGGKDGRGYKALPFQLLKKDGKIEYRCHHCEKVFGQLSNLKVHLRTHTVSILF